MNNTKYQFNQNQSIIYFEKKNEFIDFCQTRYADSFNSRRKYDFSFSFDYGQSWHHINDFKLLRQIIQNGKKVSDSRATSSVNKKSPRKVENAKSGKGFSVMQILGIPFLLWVGLSFYNKNISKIAFINDMNTGLFGWNSFLAREGSHEEKIYDINNNAISITPSTSKDILIDTSFSPIRMNEEDLNTTTSNQDYNGIITCSNCDGNGYNVGCKSWGCRQGYRHCRSCGGKKYDNDGYVCVNCRGTGIIFCEDCNGNYLTVKKTCSQCNGQKITKKVLCSSCNGKVLSPGDDYYSELYKEGITHCSWCGGKGYVERSSDY